MCLLTGAGTSQAAGLPGIHRLAEHVLSEADDQDRPLIQDLLDGRNIEEALSRVRRIGALLQDGETFETFSREIAERVDQTMSRSIISAISNAEASVESFEALASWLAGEYYTRPIEVFTVNYDTLLEEALESVSALYFDGFVGVVRAQFHAELVDTSGAVEQHQNVTCVYTALETSRFDQLGN